VSRGSRFAEDGDGRGRAVVSERSSSGGELLRLPVCVNGAELGRPTDLLVDLDRLRVVGLDVHCGPGAQRFLPLAAAELSREQITASSRLALLDESAYYNERGASLRSLRGAAVELAGRQVGTLFDIVLNANGEVTRVVVKGESGKLRRLSTDRVRIRQRKAKHG
jgi:sporulation protein YlmC with PRC-barrel domain